MAIDEGVLDQLLGGRGPQDLLAKDGLLVSRRRPS
jgi:hypothetical protein